MIKSKYICDIYNVAIYFNFKQMMFLLKKTWSLKNPEKNHGFHKIIKQLNCF